MTSNFLNKKAEAVSQVASISNRGKKIGKVVIALLVILMVIWALFGNSHKDKTKPNEDSLKSDYHGKTDANGASTSNDPNAELTEKIRQMRDKLNAEKLAQSEKLYKVRQSAPIAMYTASTNAANAENLGGENISNVTAGSSGKSTMAAYEASSGEGGNLPLSASQVNRLKSRLGIDADTQFQQNASHTAVETVSATQIAHTDYTVTQGTLIPGSLQTAINSDLPGMVKASVSMDVYAAAGNRVLIPKGSTLIGQYNAGIAMGQVRVLVVWTRAIRPDGIDVMLGSPGTDALGQGGLGADALDTHFWSRFGQASMLSIVGAGIANAGVGGNDQFNSAAAYRTAISGNFQDVAGSALLSTMNIKPTIHIHQGAQINVFVNRDLSFYDALAGKP